MKFALKFLSVLAFSMVVTVAMAQTPEDPGTEKFPDSGTDAPGDKFPDATPTPGGRPAPSAQKPAPKKPTVERKADADRPLDGVVARKTIMEKMVLPYETVRESDIMWERFIWRVIDVREKINLPFTYPSEELIAILMRGIADSSIRVYDQESDKFLYRLSNKEAATIGSTIDTIEVTNPITYEKEIQIVNNRLNPEDIKRYRIKEQWYFDKEASVLKVRILGIAPMRDVKDQQGNFIAEQAMFWIYYPDCREYLARQRVFTDGNAANPMSWEDLFEMRRFSSYIYKEDNVHDRRIQDYATGIDILLEGEKIKQDIFNWEHDLWSY
jgi:gliding motility associated protien GldN